jgi:serine/threonine protein kinase/Flp pilus assembly protein TadD
MVAPQREEAAIFNAARRIEAAEARRQYLEEACGQDRELLSRLEALLRVHDEDRSFLHGTAPWVTPTPGGKSSPDPPTQIGPYKLRQQLGEGGFGVVHLAEQEQPVRRQVALKVIKPGMDSAQVIARFESERQALALMEHPGIAKVLDAGATDTGQPYFVMELVRGVPITDFCDKHRLPVDKRLELFVSVCQAIQHAHHKGVIHRDIKPSNVLVTTHEGSVAVKVIDFGIAKATQQPLTDKAVFTADGQMIGTPGYMSPEQAAGLDIDTRSDVYSLGVLLYELLTGVAPVPRQQFLAGGYATLQRLICEEEPPRPSARLSALEEAAATDRARARGTDPRQLVRLLAGDLDWVVMKALEKDRNRRYPTPGSLAEDVERYLHREVVLARPPSATYRLGKFARRHRGAMLAAAAVAAALLTGTAVSVWQAVRATRAERAASQDRDRAVLEKSRADEQAAVANAVNDFFQNDLLAQASAHKQARPGQSPERDLTVRTLLDRAGSEIAGKFDGQPLVEANIRNTMGVAYDQLGEHAKAQQHFARARDLYLEVLGPDDVRTLRATNNLANTFLGQGRLEESLKLFEDVVGAARRVYGPTSPDTLGPMNNLANVLARLRRWDEARALHEEALAGRRQVLGPDDPATLQSMNNLADVLRVQGHLDSARRLQEEALAGQIRVLGPDNPHTLGSMYNIAVLLWLQGQMGEATAMFEKVLEAQSRVQGRTHPDTLAMMNSQAWRLATAADPKRRDPRRAVQLAREVVQYQPRAADKWNTLGVACYRAGDLQGAIAALEKSEQLAPGQFTAENHFFLAMAHWQLGEKDKARDSYAKAVAWMKQNQPGGQELLQFQAEASRLTGTPDARAPR